MIVYSGKQFWNNFNNWDEGVFQDASRPRDEDMFRIQPWFQTQRMDWKATNKNREPSLFHVYWYHLLQWFNPVTYKAAGFHWVVPARVKFKSTYTESDFSSITPFATAEWGNITATDLRWYVQDAYWSNWDAKVAVRNESLEIMEDGVYFLDFFAQFVMPNWYSYSASQSYPLWLALLRYDEKEKNYPVYAYTQSRTCFYLDRVHETVATPILKWTRLSLGVWHGYTAGNILVACWITAVRIW